MEIKYDKTVTIDICGEKVTITKYIDSVIMETIVNAILEKDNPIERDIVKEMYVVKLLTDINIDTLNMNDFKASGEFYSVTDQISNYAEIDAYIAKYESVNRVVKLFLDEIITKIPTEEKIMGIVEKIKLGFADMKKKSTRKPKETTTK